MADIEALLIAPDASLYDAIERIDEGAEQIALVVDQNRTLLGLVTDGDVRRAILRRLPLTAPVKEIMNQNPQTALAAQDDAEIMRQMQVLEVQQLPLLDEARRVVGLRTLKTLIQGEPVRNHVVLMAGGLGTRLRPLTENTPKPMLPVGGQPLLEIIINAFLAQGFRRFSISLNYQGDVIKDHFGDGRAFGAEIDYLEERQRMGTAGSLSLLTERPNMPFIVMNGDLLTSVDFRQLVQFHIDSGAPATMAVREQTSQIPYGVVTVKDHHLASIEEKPTQSFFINAGIYVLNPDVLDMFDPATPLDMTDLFLQMKDKGDNPAVFPMREYWLDIGHPQDLERAKTEFADVFGK